MRIILSEKTKELYKKAYEKWFNSYSIGEKIKIADLLLPLFMSEDDYKELCELTEELEKRFE